MRRAREKIKANPVLHEAAKEKERQRWLKRKLWTFPNLVIEIKGKEEKPGVNGRKRITINAKIWRK